MRPVPDPPQSSEIEEEEDIELKKENETITLKMIDDLVANPSGTGVSYYSPVFRPEDFDVES